MKLTDSFVACVQSDGKLQKHFDGGGLLLCVTPAGWKSWRLVYRYQGKQRMLVLGAWPDIKLQEARQRRDAAKRLLMYQVDPSKAKHEAGHGISSFEIVAREWFGKYSAPWVECYKNLVLARLENHIFPYIGDRPISSITTPELLNVVRILENRGALCAAHQVLRYCGRIFRYAIATGRAERDVAADLRGAIAPAIGSHWPTITEPMAVGRLLLSLDKAGPNFTVTCAMRLAPLFFVRTTTLARAEWNEFDFSGAEWRIPAVKMKTRQTHIVPLAKQAISILRGLQNVTGKGKYLFPGKRSTSQKIKPVDCSTLITYLRRLGYSSQEMTFHGFRSMASTLLNELGYNRDWIERQLAHCERDGVRAAYNYAQYLPERRRMMQSWADYLDMLKSNSSNLILSNNH